MTIFPIQNCKSSSRHAYEDRSSSGKSAEAVCGSLQGEPSRSAPSRTVLLQRLADQVYSLLSSSLSSLYLFLLNKFSLGATLPSVESETAPKPEPAKKDLGEEEPEISPSEGDPGDEPIKPPAPSKEKVGSRYTIVVWCSIVVGAGCVML